MSCGLSNIILLAFALSVKANRRNSMIYGWERAYKVCKAHGICPQSFKKYIKALDEKGLIQHTGNGHRRIVSITALLPVLFPNLTDEQRFKAFRYCRFFAGCKGLKTVKDFKSKIEQSILKLNLDQQQSHIDAKNKIKDLLSTDRTNCIAPKAYKALLKRYNAQDLLSLSRTLETLIDYCVTGKTHFANLLGCSESTSRNRLRTWDKEGVIARTIVRKFIPCPVSHASSDALKDHYRYACPNPDRTGFWVILGSAVRFSTPAMQ